MLKNVNGDEAVEAGINICLETFDLINLQIIKNG